MVFVAGISGHLEPMNPKPPRMPYLQHLPHLKGAQQAFPGLLLRNLN